MKRIFFIRHAKSSWADAFQEDIDRPLNTRGKRDAPSMSKKLSEIIDEVDLIICSPARRARDTAAFFSKKIKSKQFTVSDQVYHASLNTLVDVVRDIENDVQTVLIFGHNPGFTSVFNNFSEQVLDNLPTCGIFEIKLQSNWKDIRKKNTKIKNLIYPKMYK